ncbi:integumentary mucin C.1-like isoform X2 [Haliotis rubra]|uniref:integumentary mucin C.1-like isoform X2 n=1 Tax=Haliotis rubra TaxID=36100 RepID=UPI001EE589BC|nr:integumentary mucin C.1-like isoform X2 [Haliotis rubra]
MDVLLTLAVLTVPAVISGLQACSSGTDTSSTQILLDVSSTQINTGGGMCSCRLTVTQTTQVDMFTVSWTPQCDTYMTIQKWGTSTQCTNGVVQTPPAKTHTITTGEEIWILVVATKPGSRGLSGQLQLKAKQPSALQTCSSGTKTSSTQILLDVSTTQINTRGGMCSCRVTVSQKTQVDMFPVSWTPGCDTYMTIPKWKTSTQCTNGAVQSPPAQTHTVNTGEEIWILVVATIPGTRGLSAQLQFKAKQPSDQLNIECFEPNSNSSTTTTPSTTTVTASTTSSTSRRNVVTTTSPKTTRRITPTSTSLPTTHTETLRSPDTTSQGQPTSPPGSTAGTRTTEASTAQYHRAGCHTCNDDFPGGIFAAGVATGAVLVLIAGGLYVVISRRQWWTSRHQKTDDIPISEAHPTYSGFTSRTEEPINIYDKLDPKPSKGTDHPYINVS